MSILADPSLVAFLKSRRSGNVDQKNEIKMEQNRPEEFVESLTVPQRGVGMSLSMQESGLEEAVRRDESTKMEITGKRHSVNVLNINVRFFLQCLHQPRLEFCGTLFII